MSSIPTCPRCGAGLTDLERIEGLCAGCLLVAGLESKHGDEAAQRARVAAPTVQELAPHFPDLEIVELVGQGGMGAVYRVRQTKLGREAALKVLALDAVASPAFGERFEREARTLAALDHENIVHVYDSGRAGPWWYLLMEFVDGVSLRQMIRAREVDPRTALAIVAQVCDALQCAHDHGVVHRDIKPENVLVDRKGRAKILDFGLAKLLGREPRTGTLTETGQIMGTPRYMAPEQWERPLTVDHRADIYSVGVVFYELLTGELPIGAFALPSQKGAPDARVDSVVMKTLAKEPERRYQHASEVRTDVRRIESTPSSSTNAPNDEAPVRRRDLKRVAWIAFGVTGCLTILLCPVLALAFLLPGYDRAGEARALAEHAHAAALEAERSEREAMSSPARAEGRVDRAREVARAGPPPEIDRARVRALGWGDSQMNLADALLDLAWHLNLSRAVPELDGEPSSPEVTRFRLRPQTDAMEAHRQLLETLCQTGTLGQREGDRDGRRRLLGYSFSGPGYWADADSTGVLSWYVAAGAFRETPSLSAPGLRLPAGTTMDSLFDAGHTWERPWFGAEEWLVTLRRGPAPTATIEVGGVKRELTTEELQGTHRALLSMADEVAPPTPR